MIDLHTHTIFSDGVLIPAELIRRFETLGYSAVAITDHADLSTLDFTVPRIVRVAEDLNQSQPVKVIPGIEITHTPPGSIGRLVGKARALGAKLVVIHGETIVEPVAPGTNRAGLEAEIDILAHPGLITREEVEMAAEKSIYLEISARAGHSLTNGHVVNLAKSVGAPLVINSDAHAPRDLMTEDFAREVAAGAGLSANTFPELLLNARQLLDRIGYSI